MRHRNKINSLGRTTPHRKAMLANMAASLIEHKRINTTLAKAKALRRYVEPLITRSKTDSTHSRRLVFRSLQSKDAVTELFREVAQKVADRPGGYTRIIRTGNRLGDNAEMCLIELVDYNEIYSTNEKSSKAKGSKRSRRGGKKSTSALKDKVENVAETTAKVEEKVSEEKEVKETVAAKKVGDTKETADKAKAVVAKKAIPGKSETPKAEEKADTPKAGLADNKEPKEAKSKEGGKPEDKKDGEA